MRKPTIKKILMWTVLSLLVLIVVLVVFLLTFDWNRAKPYINRRVSEATGRVFEIRGNLALHWQRPAEGPAASTYSGWRRLVPWPRLSADDIQLSNPGWAKTGPQMVQLTHVTFSLSPLPLLAKTVVVPELEADGLALALERGTDPAQAPNNWTFKKDDNTPSTWRFALQRLILKQAQVHYLDPLIKLDMHAGVNTLADNNPQGYGLEFKLDGSYNKAPVTGGGKAGGILSLENPDAVYPIQADIKLGKNAIGVEGRITKPTAVTAIDLQLSLAGASMANLYPLTGVLLPDTPPYATKGHLIGKLDQAGGDDWTYENFTGKVGDSDIAGTLEYLRRQPRPLLRGKLVSAQLRLADLGPLVKADSNASKANRGAAQVQPAGKVLPAEPFDTKSWGVLDADIDFTGRKIIRDASLPIQDMHAVLHLENSMLSLTPLNFGVAGGNMTSNITLDGGATPIKAEMKMAARHLKIKQLFPKLESMQASFGEVNGDVSLSGVGNSVGALLGTSNGEIKAVVSKGSVSKFILEAAGLNIANAAFVKIFGDKQVQMNCLAADFAVTDGLMQTRSFVMDTSDAVVNVSGDINLAKELLALDIRPKSKGLRVISLRTPLYAKGTFKNPDIGLYKGMIALKAGAAAGLAAVAPLAALAPLINIGRTEDTDCAGLLSEASTAPTAPPPGKKEPKKRLKRAQQRNLDAQ
ncbi:AsmA family protein [Oxalobacteraceae bacterium CAVE-383]|nr:AsmA family protein [Oxalobacteraceae bacterium CAVE-383]